MIPVSILTRPRMSDDAGLRAAYLRRDGAVVLIAGAASWTFPSDGWRLAELRRMADALSVIMSDQAIVLLQRRAATTNSSLGPHTIVVAEPLLEQHLLPLVEAGELGPMEALRALAWTKLNP